MHKLILNKVDNIGQNSTFDQHSILYMQNYVMTAYRLKDMQEATPFKAARFKYQPHSSEFMNFIKDMVEPKALNQRKYPNEATMKKTVENDRLLRALNVAFKSKNPKVRNALIANAVMKHPAMQKMFKKEMEPQRKRELENTPTPSMNLGM